MTSATAKYECPVCGFSIFRVNGDIAAAVAVNDDMRYPCPRCLGEALHELGVPMMLFVGEAEEPEAAEGATE